MHHKSKYSLLCWTAIFPHHDNDKLSEWHKIVVTISMLSIMGSSGKKEEEKNGSSNSKNWNT
jgi:hypothetical protein